ncbi:MAG: hypothetical protein U9N56_10890 [Actinomycetota bacterium]|nr:hypothetical protein [Actinomycetota bacterium]
MTWQGRLASFAVVGSVLLATMDIPEGPISLAVIAVFVALAWRFTDGFWKTVAFGLVGGVVAGVLIMGPGFRLAMRVVAIMDPTRSPEFSVGGTLFIIVGIGGIFGGVIAIAGNLIRKAVPVTSVVTGGMVPAGILMAMLLVESDLREEFVELGGGPWVNIPMFSVVAIGYGIAAVTITDRLKMQADQRAVTETEKVPA